MIRWLSAFLLVLGVLPAAWAQEAGDRVQMNLDDFLKMYDAAQPDDPADPEGAAAPVAFSIVSLDLDGRVDPDAAVPSATFDATARVEVLQEHGWTIVPILQSDAALLDATIGGRPARVVRIGSATSLLVEEPGVYDLRYRFAVALTDQQGVTQAGFGLTPAGRVTLTLALPTEDDLDVDVLGAKAQTVTETRDGLRVEATLGATNRLAVGWRRAGLDEDADRVARVQAHVDTLVRVGGGLLRADARITHTIRFAGVDAFAFAVPEGMTVLDVRGAGLRDWVVEDGRLDVQLAYEAEGTHVLDVDLERTVREETTGLDTPLLRPLDVERTQGFVGVASEGTLEVDAGAITGASAVDVRTLPAPIVTRTSLPLLLGFKYLDDGARIPLDVVRHDDVDVLVTLLDHVDATTLFTRDGRRLSRVRYQLRNNRRQFLRVDLPEGATLWSAAVAGQAVQPVRDASGGLLVPLIRSASREGTLSAFEAELVYVEGGQGPDDRGNGRFAASLPGVQVPATYVSWSVWVPDGAIIDLRKAEGDLRPVAALSRAPRASQAFVVEASSPGQQRAAGAQASGGGLGDGAAPVRVELPLQGTPVHFEKVLSLEETLAVAFPYRRMR